MALTVTGCGDREEPASAFGEEQFRSVKLSTSPFAMYSCSTCHEVTPGGGASGSAERIDPGFNLQDVVHRPSWWGGDKRRLLDAINYCLSEFMGGKELEATDDRAKQLYEYLAANSPTKNAGALPLTVVKNVTDLAAIKGSPEKGKMVYDRSCLRCHGQPHTGAGRLSGRASLIPEATMAVFGAQTRAVVVEKVRHGKFFNLAGNMPLYPLEAMSDEELADVLAYMGL